MREIGGYIELDQYKGPMLHNEAIALNSARNALAYILRARKVKKLWVPRFICDSVIDICKREGVSYDFYSVGKDFYPQDDISLRNDEWLYIVNYYSQISNIIIKDIREKHKRIIIDNVQSYFQMPLQGVDTIYTCRKYFGVADGAFLYTDSRLHDALPTDSSFQRMKHILGRFEGNASDFYLDYITNEEIFRDEPVKYMSKLTFNLLHGIDYQSNREIRMENFAFLHKKFMKMNQLCINQVGTFMYPLMISNGYNIRKKLQLKRIYIPTLWPDVLNRCKEGDGEYQMALNILPLPIDQRYSIRDMQYMSEILLDNI